MQRVCGPFWRLLVRLNLRRLSLPYFVFLSFLVVPFQAHEQDKMLVDASDDGGPWSIFWVVWRGSLRKGKGKRDSRIGTRAMRRFVQLALGFVTLALTCGVSSGSWRIHRRAPSFAHVWNLKVGSAALYDVDSERGKSAVELAIVGKEPVY